MLDLADEAAPGRISKALNNAILRILLPAECAVEWLIVAAAQGVTVKLPPPPRLWSLGHAPIITALFASCAPAPKPKRESSPGDGLVDATDLLRRLQAIKLALADIPREARRLVHWKTRREQQHEAGFVVQTSPLREGYPPGSREPPRYEVEKILDGGDGRVWETTKLDTS
jgi:hypothetical protein